MKEELSFRIKENNYIREPILLLRSEEIKWLIDRLEKGASPSISFTIDKEEWEMPLREEREILEYKNKGHQDVRNL